MKVVTLNLPGLVTYQQDVTDQVKVRELLGEQGITQVDLIQSDMAPNTTGIKDLDAMRSMGLIQDTLWMYKEILKPEGKFVIKVFM
ncbi:TPA: hypothetical protein DIC40_08120 [Patescibacteria group bacterium]|nr:hypothetical protein [Candidatus Gracilibacteria bacterium]